MVQCFVCELCRVTCVSGADALATVECQLVGHVMTLFPDLQNYKFYSIILLVLLLLWLKKLVIRVTCKLMHVVNGHILDLSDRI
jgi:hypothetical protein